MDRLRQILFTSVAHGPIVTYYELGTDPAARRASYIKVAYGPTPWDAPAASTETL